jgi:hypothetical protein
MKNRKLSIRAWWVSVVVGLACFLPVSMAWAQETVPQPSIEMREDFSDNELQSFVKANEKVMTIQMEAEQNMIKAIKNEGLTLERFNEILEQQRDPQRGTETPAEDLESFNNAAKVILEENARVEKEMTSSVEAEGIDIETYKQIMLAYQQNPTIQGRVNKIVNPEN